jgi:HPt (histidine-containing phosphotransfer) domain-containing protein
MPNELLAAPPLAAAQDLLANPAPAVDREVIEELVREIGEQASEIHAVFAAETAIRLKLFRELSIEQDRIRIGREAHSLKSSAGTFGYRELASLAEGLEEGVRWLAEGEYRALLDRIDAAYSAAEAQPLGLGREPQAQP